jgi:hypothetical protein
MIIPKPPDTPKGRAYQKPTIYLFVLIEDTLSVTNHANFPETFLENPSCAFEEIIMLVVLAVISSPCGERLDHLHSKSRSILTDGLSPPYEFLRAAAIRSVLGPRDPGQIL